MKLIIAMLLALPAFPQITATVKPIPISGSVAAIGSKNVGLWNVDLCSRYPVSIDISRARVEQYFPLLLTLDNRLAEDLLNRSSATSFWSQIGRYGPTVVTIASAAIGAHGIAIGNDTQIGIGQAMPILTLLFSRASQRAPNPSIYFSDLMPAQVTVPANDCAQTYKLASGIVRGAATMTALIDIPGINQPIPQPQAELVTPDLAAERLEKILRARGLDDREILAMVSQ